MPCAMRLWNTASRPAAPPTATERAISHSSLVRRRRRRAPASRTGQRRGGERKETSIIKAPLEPYGRAGGKNEARGWPLAYRRPRGHKRRSEHEETPRGRGLSDAQGRAHA